MAQSIQRLRYYDGEYLRSNDFSDEQSYHVAMRRRLNLELHLSGIVEGLEIQQDANSVPPNALFFAVTAGFAIDQLGREIVVSAPYELSSDNVLGRTGLQTGPNEVWIVYTETAAGLPAPGYQLCDQPRQNTRWAESFDIRLKPSNAPPSTIGNDPNNDLKGVLLGHVTLKNDPVIGWTITSPRDTLGRTYVGIRAQSIVAPDKVDLPDPFKIEIQNVVPPAAGQTAQAPRGYLDVAPSAFARGNVFVEQNMVVGDDFVLDHTANPNLPAPGSFPPNGNVKLNGDLFLKGSFFSTDPNGKWLGLKSYIQTLVPDIQFPATLVHFDFSGGVQPPPQTVPVSTTLPSFSRVDVQASIAAFQFVSQDHMNSYIISASPPAVHPSLSVSASFSGRASPTVANILVSCFVGGGYPPTNPPPTQSVLFQSLDVALVVVFRP